MEMHFAIQKRGQRFPIELSEPIVDLSNNPSMFFCLVEGGMSSGEPAVVLGSIDIAKGSTIMATSLDKFLAAAASLKGAAEVHFGWQAPEGSFTIIPPDRETRRHLLQAISKELKEWDVDI